jgi:hypothetical protein
MATAPVGKSPLSKNRLARPPAPPLSVAEAETEPPSMLRLTAIIAACFSIGVAWPIIAGQDFVQRPPGSNNKPLDIETAPGDAEPIDPSTPTPAEIPAAHTAPLLTTRTTVSVERHKIQSCQGDAGEVVARCDEPNLEGVIDGPIAKLADCDAADGASGVLSLGLHLDFAHGHVTRVKAGQSTTLSKGLTTRLIACAEETLVGTPLDGIEHEHGRYWMYYWVRLSPPGSPVEPVSTPASAPVLAPASDEMVSASGQATIGWTTAVVRANASANAPIAARLSYGTRVSVTGRLGDWYRIEHLGKRIGWVHRQAIGM